MICSRDTSTDKQGEERDSETTELTQRLRAEQPNELKTWHMHNPANMDPRSFMAASFGQMTTNVINVQANVQGRAVGKWERPKDVGEQVVLNHPTGPGQLPPKQQPRNKGFAGAAFNKKGLP